MRTTIRAKEAFDVLDGSRRCAVERSSKEDDMKGKVSCRLVSVKRVKKTRARIIQISEFFF